MVAKPDQHNLATLVRSTLSAAQEAGLRPCVYFYSDLSQDCKVLRQHLDHPLMVDAFAGMYVLRVSAQEFRLRARDLGFRFDSSPAIFRLDDQGRVAGRIDPSGWGFKSTPEKMADALKRFFSEEAGRQSGLHQSAASPTVTSNSAPRVASVQAPHQGLPTAASSEAQTHYEQACRWADQGNWIQAFAKLRSALNCDHRHAKANALLRQAWCPSCKREVPQPSPSHSTVDYARFWRGVCPRCTIQLRFRPDGEATSPAPPRPASPSPVPSPPPDKRPVTPPAKARSPVPMPSAPLRSSPAPVARTPGGNGHQVDIAPSRIAPQPPSPPPRPTAGADITAELRISFAASVAGDKINYTVRRVAGNRETIVVEVPPGTGDGAQLRLRGQGERGTGGGPSGDLLVTVRIAPKPTPPKHTPDICEEPVGSEILLEAATPTAYRVNAFRVLGMSVDAGARDISKYTEMLRIQENLGIAAPVRQGVLPLAPPPDVMAVRDAMQRLHDPERRLVDEFFWFWPQQFGQSKTDEALRALTEGKTKAAQDTWLAAERQSSDGNVSRHNLAVLAHVTALDFEYSGGQRTLSEDERQQRDQSWSDALQRWKALLEHEGFWSRLSARIRDLSDHRLTAGTARRFRNSLPLALLSINAQLAVRAADRGERSEAARHVTIIRRSDFQESVISEVLRRAVGPIRQRIKLACQAAQASADAEPEHADQMAGRLLEQTRPLLDVLDCTLGTGHPIRDGAYDEVALTVLRSQVAFGKKTENWEVSLQLLRQALPLAVGRSVRSNIEENIRIVEGNLQHRQTSGTCWFCRKGRPNAEQAKSVKLHLVVERILNRVRYRQAVVKVPRCFECQAKHFCVGLFFAITVVIFVIAGIGCLAGLNANDSSRSKSTATAPAPSPYVPRGAPRSNRWPDAPPPSGYRGIPGKAASDAHQGFIGQHGDYRGLAPKDNTGKPADRNEDAKLLTGKRPSNDVTVPFVVLLVSGVFLFVFGIPLGMWHNRAVTFPQVVELASHGWSLGGKPAGVQ